MNEYFISYSFNKGSSTGNGMNSIEVGGTIDSYEKVLGIAKAIGEKESLQNVVINNFILLKEVK